jgi:hypothetical protein
MQNRNIDERLQILNDYIQRTIDALNVTRQVATQTLGSPMMQMGLSHTPYMGWQQSWQQPQYVQTPQGLVPVNPYFSPVQPMGQIGSQFGYGLQHSGFVPNFGYGVQQHPFVPGVVPNVIPQVGYGVSSVTPWTNVPVGFVPYGVQQHFGQQVSPQVQNRDLGLSSQASQVNLGQTQI